MMSERLGLMGASALTLAVLSQNCGGAAEAPQSQPSSTDDAGPDAGPDVAAEVSQDAPSQKLPPLWRGPDANHSCVIRLDGTLWCWGDNKYGQVGDGTYNDRLTPVQVPLVSGALAVELGADNTCALTQDGALWCWGNNSCGQLGFPISGPANTPRQMTFADAIQSVAIGDCHVCAVLNGGDVLCWGANVSGQLGTGSTDSVQHTVHPDGLAGITQVAAAGNSSFALDSGGNVWSWGDNFNGQMGNGSMGGNQPMPTNVSGVSDVAAIAVGALHACAHIGDGSVWCWGFNGEGELGVGPGVSNSTGPVRTSAISNADMLWVGGGFSLARLLDDSIWGWGGNDRGELGDGTTQARTTPVRNKNLDGFRGVALGSMHACGVRDDGVWCWGANDYGQLGDGSTADHGIPMKILDP